MTITLPSMKVIAPGVPFSAAAVNAAIRQQRVNLQNIVNGMQGFEKLTWVNSAATLATDTLDLTSKTRVVVVDTEGAGATDNLSTISNGTAYQQLWIKAADVGRVITVKHGVGNIKLWGAADVVLNSTNWLHLFYDGTQWSDGPTPTPVTASPSFVINTARTVLGANAASVTISSIPATYQHLLLVLEVRTDFASTFDNLFIRFNADSATNYYFQDYFIFGTTITGQEGLGVAQLQLNNGAAGATASAGNATVEMLIKNYASTTMRRTATWMTYIHAANTTGNIRVFVGGGDWTNTAAAISSITFLPGSGTNILANSAYTLYGLN